MTNFVEDEMSSFYQLGGDVIIDNLSLLFFWAELFFVVTIFVGRRSASRKKRSVSGSASNYWYWLAFQFCS